MSDQKKIKPEGITPELLELMKNSGYEEMAKDFELLKEQGYCRKILNGFITQHPEMIKMKQEVEKLAIEDDPVLIHGESGTGKEIIANALHGDRKGRFIAINCAGIPETLLESELFGHVVGAFTDAKKPKAGLLKEANDGTAFLDEIGDMPLAIQSKILRAVDKNLIRPLGATEEIEISCRFVFATHRNLFEMAKVDRFREDLYWRISTFILRPTPIRQRMKDVPLIIKHIDETKCIKDYEAFCKKIDEDSLTGNVRTLQQIVRRYCVLRREPHE